MMRQTLPHEWRFNDSKFEDSPVIRTGNLTVIWHSRLGESIFSSHADDGQKSPLHFLVPWAGLHLVGSFAATHRMGIVADVKDAVAYRAEHAYCSIGERSEFRFRVTKGSNYPFLWLLHASGRISSISSNAMDPDVSEYCRIFGG